MLTQVFVILAILAFVFEANAETLKARAWQSANAIPELSDFPEVAYLSDRPNTAIAFTGGGSRAYTASIGYLAGLNALGLVNTPRYVCGISGGTWATSSFSFAQHTTDDNVLLGSVLPPEEFTVDKLKEMDPRSLRATPAKPLTLIAIEALKEGVVATVPEAWAYGVSQTYLEPIGVKPGKMMTWNQDSLKDILSRNPQLSASDFVLPTKPERPYPLMGTTLVGPCDYAPYDAKTHNYTMIEMTPLYVGTLKTTSVDYSATLHKETRNIGGAIEPFAFARVGTAPSTVLADGETSGILSVPAPEIPLDVQFVAAASSYAPGSLVESLKPEKLYDLGMHFDYWSPVSKQKNVAAEDTLYTDGGAYENIMLINLLQRKVERIVLFYSSSTPLAPASKWNPATDKYDGSQVSDVLSTFFGVFPEDQANWQERSFEYEKNQVFARNQFAVVVQALQKAQAEGKGLIATFDLETVANEWWGIPAGQKVRITFSYLGRLSQWESRLPSDMKSLFIPEENSDDLSVDIKSGPFRSFPHYATLGGMVDNERANALADLAAWSVVENADVFRSMLQ